MADIFSNKSFLKQVNQTFEYLVSLVQSTCKPISLCSNNFNEMKEISFEFLREFVQSNQDQQIKLLSNVSNFDQLWKFLSLNPLEYDCQNFLEELYQLTSKSLVIKQHLCNVLFAFLIHKFEQKVFVYLAYHIEDFLLILGVCYDDNLRLNSYKILCLLLNKNECESKYYDRICYEYFYDFDIYYQYIQSFTIESKILSITKEDLNNLINEEIIQKDLEEKISTAIHELGGKVFFKMQRSPKDAFQSTVKTCFFRNLIREIFISEVSKEINNDWTGIWGLKPDEDPQLYFMKISNSYQLKLLLKTSDRLQQDLKDISSNGKLILRKWINDLSNEFRCFICNKQLNAVSGHYSINNQKQITDFINSQSFQNVILSIPYSHAIVDCSIDLDKNEVLLIEINPFSKRSSAGHFSWIIDKEILYNHYHNNGFVSVRFNPIS